MAPSAVISEETEQILMMNSPVTKPLNGATAASTSGYLLDRDLNNGPKRVVRTKENMIYLADGSIIFDGTGGAAVSCLGHGNQEVKAAIIAQMDEASYVNSMIFGVGSTDELAKELIAGTDYKMSKAFIASSGSEAMEAAMKLSRQYFLELPTPQPQRTNYIAREQSYHGTTLGAISMSGHLSRREPFKPVLLPNVHHVSACNAYRQRLLAESDADFVARKAAELDAKFQTLGPETVIAFVAEPIVGAALGCVPCVPGYLAAMKSVCDKYGALLILDEVMSGMGRSGTLHVWQAEGVVPDIQTMGKGLGGGYQPISAVLIGKRVGDTLSAGSGAFVHGHTYQAHPVACAAALTVQRIIRRDNLVENVRVQGLLLEKLLKEKLSSHPNVGDIRGRGLFWGLEFVKDKETKKPFSTKLGVAKRVLDMGLRQDFALTVYPGQGSADGWSGDHVIISPAYNITAVQIEFIADTVKRMVDAVFEELKTLNEC